VQVDEALPAPLRAYGLDLLTAMRAAELRAAGARRDARRSSRRRWHLPGGRSRLLLGAAGVAAAAGAGGFAAGAQFNGPPIAPQQWVNGLRVQPVGSIDAGASAAFSVLRHGRTAADAMPGRLEASFLRLPGPASAGANPALARAARGLPAGDAAWLIPADQTLCLAAEIRLARGVRTGTQACAPTAGAIAGKLLALGVAPADPGVYGIAGLVPDGVASVVVRQARDRVASVAVHDNVYVATVTGRFSVGFRSASGAVAKLGPFGVPSPSRRVGAGRTRRHRG